MSDTDKAAATVHPGAVRAIFDHLLLSLTADGEAGSAGLHVQPLPVPLGGERDGR